MYTRISAWILVVALVLAAPATAQERFGTLQGRVTDQQSAPIPGVTVLVTSLTSGDTRTFVTDANGQFVASDLNPGRYKVRFELTGFEIELPEVNVALGSTFEVNTEMASAATQRPCRSPRKRPRSSTQQHDHRQQHQRQGIRPPAESPNFPVASTDRDVRELRRNRGRLPGERRQRRGE